MSTSDRLGHYFSTMSANVRAGDGKDNGQIIRNYHKRAFDYISLALKIDEDDKGVKEEAVQWYQKGIAELQRGISIEVIGQGEHCDRAKRLQTKMITNLAMAKDRLALLGQLHVLVLCEMYFLWSMILCPYGVLSLKVVPRAAGRGQNGRPAATSKEPQKRDMKNFKNVDSKLASFILNEIVDGGSSVSFEDIAGQELAKQALQEIVILPALRPEVSSYLSVMPDSHCRVKPTQAKLSCIGLVGEGEKLVRALFAVARELQPAIIFIDEIDSLLCERKEGEHDASRRLKTEFLIQFDGVQSEGAERVLVMGATNRPQELDEAVLRYWTQRNTPHTQEDEAVLRYWTQRTTTHTHRKTKLCSGTGHNAPQHTHTQEDEVAAMSLCLIMFVLSVYTELGPEQVKNMAASDMRNIRCKDFEDSLKRIKPSVSPTTLDLYIRWNTDYGDTSAF
uniref:MIT domain-containing protein n=1 Tax=Hucho hucho TaxID=62062 RepID=A0A4W5LAM5_9TELE